MGSFLGKGGVGICVAAAIMFAVAVCIYVMMRNVYIAGIAAVIGIFLVAFALYTRPKNPEDSKPVTEAAKEESKESIKPNEGPKATSEEASDKKVTGANNDFLTKLVASKDATDKAADIPVAKEPAPTKEESKPVDVPETETPKEEPAPEASSNAEPVPDAPVIEESAETDNADESVKESEPVKEESKPVDVPETEPPKEEPVPEVVQDDADSESEEDTFTDYSPEALVRRAAWNKGLRCRRGYGDFNIQVAFVKPKVAVYVLDPSEEITNLKDIEENGWTVLRFDMNAVTDGLSEGEAIAEAVKVNLHNQKATKKKSKK